ncbi:MAG: LysR substrate-binding domain-containing protein [Hyphomicrobium sp.]|nr:LysR substrate-binding domain-containing protein [Hyphomicrobium sp.]
MPNLRQLEYLVALADTLHFRRAAERSNTTQPTISEQLRALEQRLGVQLVERSTTKVMLTPVGRQVVDVARRIIKDTTVIRDIAAGASQGLAGLVRMGLAPTVGPYLLPHVVPKLHKAHPDLKLYVREDPPAKLFEALEDGRDDLIVTPLPTGNVPQAHVKLFDEPLFLTVGADHPLAARDEVQLADLANEDILTIGPGHQLHDAAAALSAEAGAKLRPEFEGSSLDMIREMIIMGLGVSFMPGLYVANELLRDPDLKCFVLRDRPVVRTVAMIWRRSSGREEQFKDLAKFFKDAARALPHVKAPRRLPSETN